MDGWLLFLLCAFFFCPLLNQVLEAGEVRNERERGNISVLDGI